MQRGKGTKHHRRVGEIRRIEIHPKQRIDPRQPRRTARHPVIRGRETVAILVPRRGAGEQDLDDDAGEVDVAEGAAVDGQGAGGGEDEEDDCGDGGAAKVHDAVGEPGEHVEHDVLVRGEDVGEVRAVEDVFEGGEDAHPDAGAGFAGDEAGGVSWCALLGEGNKGGEGLPSGEEEDDPGQHWQCRNEELACNRYNRRHGGQQHNTRLNYRRGRRNRRREE